MTGNKTRIEQAEARTELAEILKASPKTVEYHRTKLMTGLNVHDVASLVRFAAALLFPNRASGALHAVAMDRKSSFFPAPN